MHAILPYVEKGWLMMKCSAWFTQCLWPDLFNERVFFFSKMFEYQLIGQ